MIAAEKTRFAALLNAIPPIGKIHPIGKIAVNFEPTIIFDILAQTLFNATPPKHYGFNTRDHVTIPEFLSYKIILN